MCWKQTRPNQGAAPQDERKRAYAGYCAGGSVANSIISPFLAQVRRFIHSALLDGRCRPRLGEPSFLPPNANHDRGPSRRNFPVT
jgi:hypothetical protein